MKHVQFKAFIHSFIQERHEDELLIAHKLTNVKENNCPGFEDGVQRKSSRKEKLKPIIQG